MADKELGIVVRAKGVATTTSELKKVDTALGNIGKTAGRGLGEAVKNIQKIEAAAALAAGGILVKSVQEASALNETVSKVGVVFDKSAASVIAWGENAATAMGMSKNEALGAAATYGNLLVAMGLTADQSATMSTRLVQLAGDLGSFNDMDPTEVTDKLRAGLTGESEPLKTLGININDTILKAKALEMGLIDLGGGTTESAASIKLLSLEVTDAQKEQAAAVKKYGANSREALEATVKLEKATAKLEPEVGKMPATLDAGTKAQAAYALIFEQSKTAQGDFARTSDSLANRQRTLRGELKDTAATIGGALLPRIADLAGKLSKFVKDNEPEIQRFADKLPAAFDKALAFAEKIPWKQIGEGLKSAAGFAKDMANAFINLPPEVQTTIIALAGLNKLTGGAVAEIGSELAKGAIKGILGVTAAVVNINAATVNGGGGGPSGIPVDKLGKVGLLATAGAIVADLAPLVLLASLPVIAAAALVVSKTVTPEKAKANLDAQDNAAVNQGSGALGEDWDRLRRLAIETDNPGLLSVPQTLSNEVVVGRNLRALEGLEASSSDVEKLLRDNLARPQPAPVFNFGLTAIVKLDTRDVATVSLAETLTSTGIRRADNRIML